MAYALPPGCRLYDPARDKQWAREVYQKAKAVVEEVLSSAGTAVPSRKVKEAMKRKHSVLCDDSIRDRSYPQMPYWDHLVSTAIDALQRQGKVSKADNGWIWAGAKPSPSAITDKIVREVLEKHKEPTSVPTSTSSTPEKTHERLKRIMVEIGIRIGYYTETEHQGPQYRHDVLWKQGQYKTPSHVIEICEGGLLPKDFDALHWANDPRNWGAKGILVVTDEKDFEKATKRFAGQLGLVVVKSNTVETLYKIIDENPQFLMACFR